MGQGMDHFLGVESQASAGLDKGNAAKVDPVVKGSLGNAETPRKLVDVDQAGLVVHRGS